MDDCRSTVGQCELMRTCPCCKRVLASRSGCFSHQHHCKEPLDVEFADHQHQHWRENHTHHRERARRR